MYGGGGLNNMKYLQGKYILDKSGNPKPVFDVMEWTNWIENRENTKIAFAWFEGPGTLYVSTQFTGTDRNFLSQGAPILFETRVGDTQDADGPWEKLYKEYSTKEEALAGHIKIIKYLTGKD